MISCRLCSRPDSHLTRLRPRWNRHGHHHGHYFLPQEISYASFQSLVSIQVVCVRGLDRAASPSMVRWSSHAAHTASPCMLLDAVRKPRARSTTERQSPRPGPRPGPLPERSGQGAGVGVGMLRAAGDSLI